MRLSIRTKDVPWTPELRNQVERRIGFAVDRHKQRVSDLSVYLSDMNGPKGGVDTLCQITATLRGCAKPIAILETATNILSAVYRATRRLRNRIAGSIRRMNRPIGRGFRSTLRAAGH